MKKASIGLALLAALLVAVSSLPAAYGYFTTYTKARGGWRVELRHETDIDEDVSDMTKHLTIENKESSSPVYVRARGFSGSSYPLTYIPGEGWKDGGDGFWYYEKVLEPGESTTTLDVKIELPAGVEFEDGDEFNVVVVYESTLALYTAEGEPYADWNVLLDLHEEGA